MYSSYQNYKRPSLSWDMLNAAHSTVRDASRGKPFPRASTLRIFKRVDGDFEIQHHGSVVATVTRNNILTIQCDPKKLVTVDRHLDMAIWRKSKGNYRVRHMLGNKWVVDHQQSYGYDRLDYEWHRANDPQVRKGSQIDLRTGVLLNPLGDDKRVVADKTASVEWLRLLREYRRGWRVRHKMGALNNTFEEMKETRNQLRFPTNLTAPELEAIIEQQDFSPTAVQLLLQHDIPWYLWVRYVPQEEISERLATAFDRTYNCRRDEIRKRRGILEVVPNGVLSDTSPTL